MSEPTGTARAAILDAELASALAQLTSAQDELDSLRARLAYAQRERDEAHAALRTARDWAYYWPKGYPRDTVIAAIDKALGGAPDAP